MDSLCKGDKIKDERINDSRFNNISKITCNWLGRYFYCNDCIVHCNKIALKSVPIKKREIELPISRREESGKRNKIYRNRIA